MFHTWSMSWGCNFERKSAKSTKRVVFGHLVSSEGDHLTVKQITWRPNDTAPCMAARKEIAAALRTVQASMKIVPAASAACGFLETGDSSSSKNNNINCQ